MDVDSFLECSVFVAEVYLFSYFYKLYKEKSESLRLLKEAQCFEINTDLAHKVKDNGGIVPYAIITGNIKPLATALQSQYFTHIRGVIREKVVKENKVQWIPMLRMWSSTNSNIQHSVSSIPFALCSKSGLFKKQLLVEVIDPLVAEELDIPVIYNEFTAHQNTLSDALLGFVRGERTVGVQEIESMLMENTTLTSVGKLVIENNNVKIKPPDIGTYFLTPMTVESLIMKINHATKSYKIVATIFGFISVFSFVYLTKRGFTELMHKWDSAKQRKKLEEARKKRMMEHGSRHKQDSENVPKCVICFENPVEIVILECGHTCLCINCSEHIKKLCPVCRDPIKRRVPIFLP